MNQEGSGIYRGLKQGDTVRSKAFYGEMAYVVHGFGGNAYLPLLYVHERGKARSLRTSAIVDARLVRLVDAEKRPLRGIGRAVLLKMMRRGVGEAAREFRMRCVRGERRGARIVKQNSKNDV